MKMEIGKKKQNRKESEQAKNICDLQNIFFFPSVLLILFILMVLKWVQVKFDQGGDAGFCLGQNYVKPGF